MGGLPPVPNLDPAASPEQVEPAPAPAPVSAGPAAARSARGPPETPMPVPGAHAPPPPPAAVPGVDAEAAASPPAAPQPEPRLSAAPHGRASGGQSGVQDSVEEVLQQTSEQTLRLCHLEDTLEALKQELTDLSDEMHAGFSELRAVAEAQTGAATRPTEASIGSSVTERIDYIEDQVSQSVKRQTVIIGVAVTQAVLLVIALFLIATSGKSPQSKELPATAPSYLDSKPTGAGNRVEPPPSEVKPKPKRRKRRR